MNCKNCGAPMELFERRRYYFCQHCGSFHFLETTDTDGLEVVGRPTTPLGCPVCTAPMLKAMLDKIHAVEYCERCRGVLVSRTTFVDVINNRRATAYGPARSPEPLDPRELKRHVACPSCRTEMNVHPYYGPGNIVIDTCNDCNVIWLDFAELKQVVDAPGRDRGIGYTPAPPRSGAETPVLPPGRREKTELIEVLFDLFP